MALDPRIALGVQPVQIQSPLDAMTQIAQLQQAREATEARRLAAEEAREKKNRQARLDAALTRAVKVGEDGRPTVDFAALGLDVDGETILNLQKVADENATRWATLQSANLTLDEKQAEYLAGRAREVVAAKYDPKAYGLALTAARMRGVITQAQVDQFLDEAAADPTAIQRRAEAAIARVTEPAKPTPIKTVDAQGREVTRFVTPTEGVDYPTVPTAADSVSLQKEDVLLDGKPTQVGWNPKTNTYHYRGQDVTARVGYLPPPVDPSLAASRSIANQLANMQLAGGGLTPNQRAQEINSLRNSWVRQTQPVLDRRGAVAKIDTGLAALKTGNRNAATQIIITAFNKLQDETSVVREGEYARSEQGQAVVARIQGALERISAGGANLTDADLQGLATEAKNVAQSLEGVHAAALADTRQAIESTLDDYNIPHDRVFGSSTIGSRRPSDTRRSTTPYKLGDIVTVNGQRVRVTKLLPNGKFEGDVVP